MATDLLERLKVAQVLAILRMDDVSVRGVAMAAALHAAGVRAFECTLDKPGAVTAIEILRDQFGSDSVIGAGTVESAGQVEEAAAAGADFCVSPHLDPILMKHSIDIGIPFIPGVMTPSEIAHALRLGAPAIKLFPAGSLGVDYLKTVRGPWASLNVIPTGGLGLDDVAPWLAAGAVCVGLGSALTAGDGAANGLAEVLDRRPPQTSPAR